MRVRSGQAAEQLIMWDIADIDFSMAKGQLGGKKAFLRHLAQQINIAQQLKNSTGVNPSALAVTEGI